MQFKHPEILYALFLLLIPIIVHLFQLRRFEKVAFTNVKFLKQVEIQTRKSSKLKKLLILCTRLLVFTALILAFTQPFLSSVKKDQLSTTYIYLDNSMSMQAKGTQGALLKRASQDLIESLDHTSQIQLLTNTSFLKNLSEQDLKRELLNLDYHPIAQDINTLLFQIDADIKNTISNNNEVILISDFQDVNKLNLDSVKSYRIVQLRPVNKANVSIDSVYIADQNNEYITINAVVKSYQSELENISVSLSKQGELEGKSNTSIGANDSKTLEFVVRNEGNINGRLHINEPDLSFDNELFFSINKQEKIDVLVIGDNNEYLANIYTTDEFNFESSNLDQLDYSLLAAKNLIILNELRDLPDALTRDLALFVEKGGSLCIIPAADSTLSSYKALYANLNLGVPLGSVAHTMAITKINFSHPVLKNVFEREIDNFQYPTVQSHLQQRLLNASSILSFENEQAFISQSQYGEGKVYVVGAAINNSNSTFKNSPLIVPVFYNFGRLSYQHASLSYTIGQRDELEVEETLQKDDILQISDGENSFIPLQQIGNASVRISLIDRPLKSGFYQLKEKGRTLKNLAFNYDRSESNLNDTDVKALVENLPNAAYYTDVKSAIQSVNNDYKTSGLWHLFILGALLFILVEIGLLKFLKS